MAMFSSTYQPERRAPGPGRGHHGQGQTTYDLDALHQFLYGRANSRGHVTFVSKELAAEMMVDDRLLRRCVNRLATAGKVKDLGRDGNARVFAVYPPASTTTAPAEAGAVTCETPPDEGAER